MIPNIIKKTQYFNAFCNVSTYSSSRILALITIS